MLSLPWAEPKQAYDFVVIGSGYGGAIKQKCLDRIVPLGERHFRRTLEEFVVHYHRERNHQGLGNELIDGVGCEYRRGPVRRRQRVGGVLSYYCYRAA
jgi:hypothetical protein